MHVVSGKARIAGGQSELGLMRLVAGGDAHAQRVLAHRLAPRVQRVVRRLLASVADADDAAQLALMEILRSAATFREESSIERWADRIAVRTALRHVRDQRRRSWFLGGASDTDELRAHDEDDMTREETPRRLDEYLAQLPAARREALVLKHALGYTTEEIAELTDNPIGTVKDRLVAARKQIRRLILRELKLGARGDGEHE
jgi:RNA polymerase sigma-70 factor (ECF subfamily)